MVVGVPREEHEKVLFDLDDLLETFSKTQSAIDATQARVQALELIQGRVQALEMGQARIKDQLDLLIRMQLPMAMPHVAAQAPPSSRGTEPDTA